jgi:hypothetical protein
MPKLTPYLSVLEHESILRFDSYKGATNHVKYKTGGLQSPEFMVFCLVTLHLWDRNFKNFPELRGLAYTDDDNIIGRFSQTLKLTVTSISRAMTSIERSRNAEGVGGWRAIEQLMSDTKQQWPIREFYTPESLMKINEHTSLG